MNKQYISLLLFIASIFVNNPVFAEPELESNDTLALAQPIIVDGGASIDGFLASGDRDLYRFYGMPGDIVDVDIDLGIGGSASVNTYIAIFDQNGVILRANDDTSVIDEGTTSYKDSNIEAFVIPQKGYYTVGVTSYSTPFIDGGGIQRIVPVGGTRFIETFGDYQLNINYTSRQVRQVAIRLSPGNVHYRPIKPGSRGIIKAAILSAADFNAPRMVIPSSLTFGATGDEQQNAICRTRDVNRDGYVDLVCKFSLRNAGFASIHDEAILKGSTIDGGSIEGSGYIKLVKYHRGYHDNHRDRKNSQYSGRHHKHHDDHDD